MSTAPSSSSPAAGAVPVSSAPTHTQFKGFKVPDILTWKNPAETGILLAETLGLLVVFGSTLTLRYFLKLASTIICLFSATEWISRSISGQRSGLVSSYRPSRFLPLNDKVVNDVASYVSYAFRRVTFGIQHLLDARDPIKGFKLGAFLYIAYVLLGILPLKTLVLTSIIVAFSVPPLYLQFKSDVDRAVGQFQDHIHEHVKTVHAKVNEKAGPQLDYVKKFVGPRGGFDKSDNVRPVGEVPTAAAKPTQHTKGASIHTEASPNANPSSVNSAESIAAAAAKDASAATGKPASASVKTTQVPDDVFKSFDSVPTLTGNVPIDHERLQAALAADKAKAEGAVNGL